VNRSHLLATGTRRRLTGFGRRISVGDQVFVSTKYINTTRPTKKFTETFLGLYKVIRKPSAASYQVRLPKSLSQVHPVFHVSQLEPHFPVMRNHLRPPWKSSMVMNTLRSSKSLTRSSTDATGQNSGILLSGLVTKIVQLG
jgi:hypothetical protein